MSRGEKRLVATGEVDPVPLSPAVGADDAVVGRQDRGRADLALLDQGHELVDAELTARGFRSGEVAEDQGIGGDQDREGEPAEEKGQPARVLVGLGARRDVLGAVRVVMPASSGPGVEPGLSGNGAGHAFGHGSFEQSRPPSAADASSPDSVDPIPPQTIASRPVQTVTGSRRAGRGSISRHTPVAGL